MSYQISLDDHNNLLTLYEKDILDKNNRWEQVGEWALVPGDGRMKIKKVPLIVIV